MKLYNRNQTEAVISAYMSTEKHKAYYVTNLSAMTKKVDAEDGGKRVVTIVTAQKDSVEWNRSSSAVKIYTVGKARMGNAVKPVKRYSFSEIHLTVNAQNGCKPASWLYMSTFCYDTRDNHWYLYANRDGKDFFARLDGEVEEISATEWAKHVKHGLVYNDCSTVTGSYASAGNLKRHKLVCSCMNEEGVAHLERSIAATGGISLLYTNPGRLTSAKAIAQANVRESAAYTASWNGPRIKVAAFFMGKWKLNDITTGEEYDGVDGWFAANANMYCRWMEELGHEVMTEEAVSGIVGQERPFSFKGVSTSMPGKAMAKLILDEKALCHGAEVVVVRASNVSREQQDAFHEAIESKGKKGAFAGKTVVVIYDDAVEFDANDPASYEQVDVLGDLNAEKAEQDLTMPSYLNILKLFHKAKKDWSNGMGTSTQLLQSLMPVAPHLKAITRIGFRAQMGKSVEDITREEARSVTTQDVLSSIKQARPVAADEAASMELTDAERSRLSNNDYGMNVVQLAELLAPTYCWERDAALFKDELKAAVKAGKSRADRVRVPIDGTDFVLVPDFAAMFGTPVLGLTEDKKYKAYSNLINQVGVEEGAMIKYPKQHCYEMSSLVFQSEADVAELLAGNENASLIAYLYATVSEAAMLCPAISAFMSQNAGLDFDGDDGFVTLVLSEEAAAEALDNIDWSLGWKAQEKYVKIQIALWMGRIRSLVVDIDADAEDKTASALNKKLKNAVAVGANAKPSVTVDVDKLWDGVVLGENMPSRKEIEAWGIMNPGNEASVRNIENANLDVGIVTVIHLVFSHLFFALSKMEGKADADLNAEEKKIVEVAKAIMTTVFENKEVKGEKYTPFTYFDAENGLRMVHIDINEYHRVRESSKTMELTRENMKLFFFDLIANARMAQEMTIDACKTLQVVANIEYAASLRKYVKLLSRQKDMDIDFGYGDKDSHVTIVEPSLGNATKVVTKQTRDTFGQLVDEVQKIVVRDWAYDLKLEGYKAVTSAIRPLLNNKPAFDADLIQNLTDMATNYPEALALADFFKTTYMHLNSAQDQAISKAVENISDDKEIALAKSEEKSDHAGFFNAIGDTIRRGLKNFAFSLQMKGLDADEVAAMEAALLISLAYKSKNGNVDSKLSSFAYRVLPEEYMRFILTYACADDDRVARYTEDALVKVDRSLVNAGDKLSFKDGEGYLHGDVVAKAKDALNGEYTILEDGNKLIASKDVLDLMPLQKDNNTLIVELKVNEWMDSHMDSVLRELAPNNKGEARWVQLWANKTQGQDGDVLHDVIAAEDEGEAYGVGYFYAKNEGTIFSLYNGVRGQVTNTTVYEKVTGEKVVLLLLENCGRADESQYVEPVFEDLPVDEGWVAPSVPVVKAKKFSSVSAPKAEKAVEEVKPAKFEAAKAETSKFATVGLEDPDMDMFEDWDYGDDEFVG